ncbi:MAG: hypothetical protein NTX50_03965 [Candidatus Sumerlaeota bacterium]|nr:hypothetical protein [Candidatus Sumerlaeota bacterium]
MKLKNVTLEMSPKPFREMSEEFVRGVCRDIFRQWGALTRNADMISVMLWTADGSEILEYRGKMEDEIEWARYIGIPNPRVPVKNDPEKKALHSRAYLYMENPPQLTYGRLAMITRVIKEVGREMTGKPIRVGATFDPGGEFAKSPFKYEKHNEICLGAAMGKGSFVCCYGVLKADPQPYAGFPKGIPQDTPLGTFFGRQCQHFLKDLGFDYIWFSNGFGFGMETWNTTGPSFDGKEFFPERARESEKKILNFWRLFRAECPDFAIETRGTNLLTGSDLATNGTPLKDIYAGGFNMMPPPNSPWAALNGDFGLELAGYMSRIAELPPDKGFPIRYYTHDPWWLNSPWLDRYGREPHDIYLPLAIGRINSEGRTENASSLSLLTIDDSYGRMPDKVPNEVTPHLLAAMDDAPDQPGPLVWVYPFEEYHRMTLGPQPRPEEPFFGDWLMRAAINNSFPLNTVVSSGNFISSLKRNAALYRESILVSPVPEVDAPLSGAMLEFVKGGGRLLLYGPLAHAGKDLLAALNLKIAAPLSGEFDLALEHPIDELSEQPYSKRITHRPLMCAGGMEAMVADPGDALTHVIATAIQANERRVAALWRPFPQWSGGLLAWVRGTNSCSYKGGQLLTVDDPAQFFAGDLLLRHILEAFGYQLVVCKRGPKQRNPVLAVARHRNGFFVSGYTPNLTTDLKLRFPQGAPIFIGMETQLEDGLARYRMPRAWHKECRVFIEQAAGEVSCAEPYPGQIGVSRRLHLKGLQNATVRFYPESGAQEKIEFLLDPVDPYFVGNFQKAEKRDDRMGQYLQVGPISGPLMISW